MSDQLARILDAKREEVTFRSARTPLADLRRLAEAMPKPRSLASALLSCRFSHAEPSSPPVRLIAEIKRASPSKGFLRPDLNPAAYAKAYARGGAAALSVLTDGPFFCGSLDDLKAARDAVTLPVLRKDFTVSEYQIYEARAAGADAILLIVRAVSEALLRDALALCETLSLDALTEVHDEAELETALRCGARIVGVNNRDLTTFQIFLETSLRLRAHIPEDRIMVAESGIRRRSDIERLAAAGIFNFLVGESLVRASNPENAVRHLIQPFLAETVKNADNQRA